MADIVRKIGKITRYETKSYVGRARILDLDRSAPASANDDDVLKAANDDRPAIVKPVAGQHGK
jgi:hypothetical protein